MIKNLHIYMTAMGGVIVMSNILVQYPLGSWLTYGALTYPLAFLVTDIVMRRHGKVAAGRVIGAGLIIGIACSIIAALFGATTLRIAFGSAIAYLCAQSLDIRLFERYAHLAWWKTPIISSVVGSMTDTFIFFFIAFSSTTFLILADGNVWAQESVQLLGIGRELPLWVSLAMADLGIKLFLLPLLLIPYRLFTK